MSMKRLIQIILVVFSIAALTPARAASPEEWYLQIYNLITQADALVENLQTDQAMQKYKEAYEELKKLKQSYPKWYPELIEFRLNYLRQKLGPLAELPPPKEATGPSPSKELPSQEQIQQLQSQIDELQKQINQLYSERTALQLKLQEALSAQPTPLDAGELARTRQRLVELEKENALLRVNLQKLKSTPPASQIPATETQLRKQIEELQQALSKAQAEQKILKEELAEAERKLSSQSTSSSSKEIGTLRAENAKLKEQLAELNKQIDQLKQTNIDLEKKYQTLRQSKTETARIRELEKERDSLRNQIALLTRQLEEARRLASQQNQDKILEQLNALRARIAVYEARAVPFSQEELNLLNQKAVITKTEPDSKSSELPAGLVSIVSEAQRAFRQGRYQDAIEKFQDALRAAPENVQILNGLAAAQIEAARLEEAAATLEKALSINSNNADSLSLKGLLLLKQNKIEEALDALSKAAQLDPNNPITQNYLGVVLSQKGLRKEAETAFRKAIQLDPTYAEAHYNLAVLYTFQDPPFPALARWHYEKAIAGGQPRNIELERKLSQLGAQTGSN